MEEDAEDSRARKRRSRSTAVGPGSPRSIEPDAGTPPPAATTQEEAEASESRSTESNPSASTAAPTAGEAYVPCSPIRVPYIPPRVTGYDSSGKEIYGPDLALDPVVFDAYYEMKQQYFVKLGCQMKLPTLDTTPLSCFNDPEFLLIQESATKTILQAAKFVIGISAYIDGELLKQCSGILIDWNEGLGTVLTSAHLILSKSASFDEWLGEQEYAPDAEVRVQLSDDIDVKGRLLYYHKHYDFALISIPMDQPVQLASFSNEVKFAQEVFVLGRDKSFDMRISNGRVQYKGPGMFQRHHYMYIDGEVPEYCTGGPVIDFNGEVIGMANPNPHMAFIPCSIILKCLHLWKTFRGRVPRLHFEAFSHQVSGPCSYREDIP